MTPVIRRRLIIGLICALGVMLVAIAVFIQLRGRSGKLGLAGTSVASPLMARFDGASGAPSMGEAAYDSSYGGTASLKAMIAPMPPIFQGGGQTAAEVDQKIIKNGSLRLTVDSVSEAIGGVTEIAKKYRGFVQTSSSTERGDGKHEGNIVIRVPSDSFEPAMADAKGLARIVNDEHQSGQDVTEQYSDLEAQLRNAQAQEAEYLVILKKAVSVEDILKVQQPLGDIRGQIESLQGRLKYLQNVTSLSNIDISLTEEATVTVPTKEFRPLTVVKQAAQALVNLAQDIAVALIWIVIVGGGVAVPVGALALLVLAWRRKAGGRKR